MTLQGMRAAASAPATAAVRPTPSSAEATPSVIWAKRGALSGAAGWSAGSTSVTPSSSRTVARAWAASGAASAQPGTAWKTTAPGRRRGAMPAIIAPASRTAPAISAHLQRGEADEREDQRDDPEADHDLAFHPAALLEMVVDRGHQEDALAGAFEVGDLDDDRERLDDEDAADDRQHD